MQQSTRAVSIKHSGLVDVYTISQTCHERRKEPSTSRLHQLKYSLAIKIVSPTKPINMHTKEYSNTFPSYIYIHPSLKKRLIRISQQIKSLCNYQTHHHQSTVVYIGWVCWELVCRVGENDISICSNEIFIENNFVLKAGRIHSCFSMLMLTFCIVGQWLLCGATIWKYTKDLMLIMASLPD